MIEGLDKDNDGIQIDTVYTGGVTHMSTHKQYNELAPTDYDKEVRLGVAYDIIGSLDDNIISTIWIDKAIKKLELLKHRRKNIPF